MGESMIDEEAQARYRAMFLTCVVLGERADGVRDVHGSSGSLLGRLATCVALAHYAGGARHSESMALTPPSLTV